jgi:ribosomal protein S12 methylthiotransferase accessory factor
MPTPSVTSVLLGRAEQLVSPFGVLSGTRTRHQDRGSDAFVCTALMGSGQPGVGPAAGSPLSGMAGGQALADADLARLVAIAEGAERYTGRYHTMLEPVTAAASALDGLVLDLARLPRCSQAELAAGCPIRPPDPNQPIRWVRGFDVRTGDRAWLPAVMACYGLPPSSDAERFWHRISTGCAAHFDPAEAVVRGICEVIERDAIAVTWLQRLPLPLIPARQMSDSVTRIVTWTIRHFMDAYLFDATTDMGVPTVYCLLVAPNDDKVRQVVGCACARTLPSAAEKALLEAIGARQACHSLGADTSGSSLTGPGGAWYMASPDRASAFDFLATGARDRIATAGRPALPADPQGALRWLLRSLERHDMRVFAVDHTPPEVSAVGLTAMTVLIPDLQPMSLDRRAQFLAHRRLYSAPALMGHIPHREEDLNPWPQPFA